MSPGVHGKDEYLQAIQVLAPRFKFFGTFFLKTKTREDRLSALTRTFCLRVLLFHMLLLVKALITL